MPSIDPETADRLILQTFENLRAAVDSRRVAISSELGLRFRFAWELGQLLEFSADYQTDFENQIYKDADDRFLDLLIWTNPAYKVAIEFKLPKKKEGSHSPTTQTRERICRDISRLSALVRSGAANIALGYFICATDEMAYVSEGKKTVNTQFKTYQGTHYPSGFVLPPGAPPNGSGREFCFPSHDVRFEWLGVGEKKPFMWLKPIRISG